MPRLTCPLLLLILLLLARGAGGQDATEDPATEADRALGALAALDAKALSEASRLVGAEISANQIEPWRKAITERREVLLKLLELEQIGAAIPSEPEQQTRKSRAQRIRRSLKADPFEPLRKRDLAGAEAERADAEQVDTAARAALGQTKQRADTFEQERPELLRRKGVLEERLTAATPEDSLGEYRRETIIREATLITGQLAVGGKWKDLLPLLELEASSAQAVLTRKDAALARARDDEGVKLREEEARARRDAAAARERGKQESDAVGRFRWTIEERVHQHRAEEMADRIDLLALKVRRAEEEQKGTATAEYLERLKRRFSAYRSASGRAGELLMRALRRGRDAQQLIKRDYLPKIEAELERFGERSDQVDDEAMDLVAPPEDLPGDLADLLDAASSEDRERATAVYLEERKRLEPALASREKALRAIQAELAEIEAMLNLQLERVEDLEAFALARMYWVRDAAPLGSDTIPAIAGEAKALVRLYANPAIGESIGKSYRENRTHWILTVLGIVILTGLGLWLPIRLRGKTTRNRFGGQPLSVGLKRVLFAVLLAAPVALCFLAAAFLLRSLDLPVAVQGLLYRTLLGAAGLVFLRRFLRSLLRQDEGILVADFKVPKEVVAQLFRTNRLAMIGGWFLWLPWFALHAPVLRSENLTRILFLLMVAWFGTVVLGLHRRDAPLVAAVTGRTGAMYRFSNFIWTIFALALATIFFGNIAGFRYGSALLCSDFALALAFLWLVYLVYLGLARLVEKTAHKILWRRDPETDAAEARRQSKEVVEQASRVFSTGLIASAVYLQIRLWGLWGIIVRLLEGVKLKELESGSGLYLTLFDAVSAVFWIILTHFLIRNLKGILEVVAFKRVGRNDPGTRFVILTVTKYLIILVGYGSAILCLQFSFSSLGWLLAAVSVGLGFGLQEIVANFVSGLILFFERPVRVGDVVTVGNATGTVEEISIRATQIVDFDRKVLFIPNRRFIVDDVVNWTHNDHMVRCKVEVGVAYGTDLKRVTDILLEIARHSPLVNSSPPPQVLFSAFGGSSLDLTMLVHTNVDHRMTVGSTLNRTIAERFEEEKIVIPFPQRDLHIHSITDEAALRALDDQDLDE